MLAGTLLGHLSEEKDHLQSRDTLLFFFFFPGGMDAFQAKLLSLTDDQTYLVMHWVVQEMMKRFLIEKGLAVPPPFVSRIQQQLSNGR